MQRNGLAESREVETSYAQERLWFQHQTDSRNPLYAITSYVRISGPLDLDGLNRSLQEVVRRHETLRTTFRNVGGKPKQVIAAEGKIELILHDLSERKENGAWEGVKQIIRTEMEDSFDLTKGPLLRAKIIRENSSTNVLVIAIHPIVADGWSMVVLFSEIWKVYAGICSENRHQLSDLSMQYADFVRWQKSFLTGSRIQEQLNYWKDQLAGFPVINFPTDRPRTDHHAPKGSHMPFVLPKALIKELKSLTSQHRATLFMTLLTAFKVLLCRYCRQEDIVIGSPIANRNRMNEKRLIGLFENILVLRTKIDERMSFVKLLLKVREVVRKAYSHQDLPFEKIIEELHSNQDLRDHSPVQIVFMLENSPVPPIELSELKISPPALPGFTMNKFDVGTTTIRFDLEFYLWENREEISGTIIYNSERFSEATIQRLLKHYHLLLERVIATPDCPITKISLLDEQEKQKILYEWNATRSDYPKHLCIQEIFEDQVKDFPDKVILRCKGKGLTFQELNQKANQVAHRLRKLGVKPETKVGISIERSLEMVIGILGILKAGGAYVPLDACYPKKRLEFMLSDVQAPVLLTQKGLRMEFAGFPGEILILDEDWQDLNVEPVQNPSRVTKPNSLAYVIYTSGSTGLPKGVCIEHRSVIRLALNTNYVEISGNDVFLQFAPISFDAATFELWGSLLNGALLEISPPTMPSLEELGNLIEENGVTILWLTAALFAEMVDSNSQSLSGVKQLLAGGDTLSPVRVKKYLKTIGKNRLINGYGPTENTTFTCCHVMDRSHKIQDSVPIGRPIANTTVYILDKNLNPVPVGMPGELFTGGDGLARGYLNNQALTSKKFIANPFSDNSKDRLYNTGDLARYLPDGTIEFLGRSDSQIKIRGFRIELGEIETVLLEHQAIQNAVTIVQEDEQGQKSLVSYLVSITETRPSVRDLRTHIAKKLPAYMIPANFVFLERIPLTPNGKLDVRGLLIVDQERAGLENGFEAPRNSTEKIIHDIWTEVLGVKQLSIHDNFMELGGHSLLAIQLISRIRNKLKVEIPYQRILEGASISEISKDIDGDNKRKPNSEITSIQAISRKSDLRLSFSQERVWFIQQLEPSTLAYNFQMAIKLTGTLNFHALEQSLNEIVRRHEIYRTTFTQIDSEPVQMIHIAKKFTLPLIDVENKGTNECDIDIEKIMGEEFCKPFDLKSLPLVRWYLLRVDRNNHYLIHKEHHIIHDGWSINVFMDDLLRIYKDFSTGLACSLTPLRIQFADFAHWERKWMKEKSAHQQLEYWREKLRGSPPLLELPFDYVRPATQTFAGKMIYFDLPTQLLTSIEKFAHRNNVTLFTCLMTAFFTLLNRYTNQTDLCVGTPMANRHMKETEDLLGMMINNVVLRFELVTDYRVHTLVQKIHQCIQDACMNQNVPFDQVVEAVKPIRDPSYNPLFQVMFALHTVPISDVEIPGLEIEMLLPLSNGSAKFDLSIIALPKAAGQLGVLPGSGIKELTMIWEYNTALFKESTITQMYAHFEKLLSEIFVDPNRRISDLDLLTVSEYNQIRFDSEKTFSDYPKKATINEIFEGQVKQRPDRIAVQFERFTLSYKELDRRANQLANYLVEGGYVPETLFGICMERSIEMIIGILGILKAGGTYVPIDSDYPEERIEYLLKDSGAPVLLTVESLAKNLPGHTGTIISIDKEWSLIENQSTESPKIHIEPDHLAYVIYTSGSTGKPKGVCITHQCIIRLICNTNYVRLTPDDSIAHTSNCSFDAATFEIWGALLSGGKLVGISKEVVLSLEAFPAALRKYEITTLFMTTALFNQIVRDNPNAFKTVKNVLFGGEAVDPASVWSIRTHNPPQRLLHVYGPTETCTFASWFLVNEVENNALTVPIGKSISNTTMYVLDEHLKPVPPRFVGELYIGGDGLARGYLNKPELTAEKFIPHPATSSSGLRLYKTGDKVRYLEDGNIEFLGRFDDQVKIRGFRIELDEIKTVLQCHSDVTSAYVMAVQRKNEDKRLAAFIVPRSTDSNKLENDTESDQDKAQANSDLEDKLIKFLQSKLPNYMIPSSYFVLDALPLTPNGKVDHRVLREKAEKHHYASKNHYVAPRNKLEIQLVKIWEKVLGIKRVGIRDDYWQDLGGHSLQAMQLIAVLEKTFDRTLPLVTFFQASTIEKFAQVLRDEGWHANWGNLVEIQPKGNKPPIFGVHGMQGHIFAFKHIAQYLGPDQPVYGIQPMGLDGMQKPLTQLDEIAAQYIHGVREIQASGPYILLGTSFGGVVAFEMARQLHQIGEKIALLGLVDTSIPKYQNLRVPDIPRTGRESRISVQEANRIALNNYDVGIYPGCLTMFLAGYEGKRNEERGRDLGWKEFVSGNVEIQEVPGKHPGRGKMSMFREPYVQDFARKLEECIERSLFRSSG